MRIIVNPDQLHQVAQQLHRANSDLRGASSNIGRIVGGMSLEIRARTNVDERAIAARRQAEALAERANSLAHYLEECAEAFQRADGQGLGIRVFGDGLGGLLGRIGAVFGGVFSTVLSGLGGLLSPTPVSGMTQLLARISDGSVLGVSTEAKDYASMRWGEKLDELERLEQEIAALQGRIPEGMTLENVRARIADLDKQIADLEDKRDEAGKRAGQWWNRIIPTWPLSRDNDGVLWRVQADKYEDQVTDYEAQLEPLRQERDQLIQNRQDLETLEMLQQNHSTLDQIIKKGDDYVLQYDGMIPAPGMDNIRGKPGQLPLDAPITNSADDRSPNRYQDVINQFGVGNNPRYARDSYTYCNTFAGDVARAMGVPFPQKREFGMDPKDRATIGFPQLYDYFTSPNAPVKAVDAGWQEVSASELGVLEDHLNRGKMAIVVNEGHVAVVSPGQQISNFDDIRIAQAGATNSNDLTLAQGFGKTTSPKIFIID
ncbi:MAG: hypothetical protein JW892_10150 [Anaerolineae bacterium]|nr:hypothetical protein [Anaerolineae bacterium]